MNLRDTIKRIIKEELGNTKSNFEKKSQLIKKLLDGKSYEGVCDYMFIPDDDDHDRVGSVMITFSEEWYRSSDETQQLNRKIFLIGRTRIEIREIINRFLNIEDLYVGSYLGKCNTSLNEQEQPKDVVFQKVLKRVIPDNSIYQMFEDFFDDSGDPYVIMKFSVLPETKVTDTGDIDLVIGVNELKVKSDYDNGYENVQYIHDLPIEFLNSFDDEIYEELRKKMGIVDFKLNLIDRRE
jgi:hypothetical protein